MLLFAKIGQRFRREEMRTDRRVDFVFHEVSAEVFRIQRVGKIHRRLSALGT
ncbi:hypothetical protein SDC9_206333 [bioreactor metagenome]|uniref:Uncharacterized protein n=1 Tax=bioreactor metagenome TaxID=1076179 RepID=A0A645J595_9ZZZZ